MGISSSHQENYWRLPVIEGRVALFPRTFKWRLDFSSPPSTTTHFTTSFVLDLTAKDIIPPSTERDKNSSYVQNHLVEQIYAHLKSKAHTRESHFEKTNI